MKITELVASENGVEMSLYVKMNDGTLIHIRDYNFYHEDYQFGVDNNGSLVEVYSHYGVSYEVRDGQLFEITFNEHNGQGWYEEITLPMLLAN